MWSPKLGSINSTSRGSNPGLEGSEILQPQFGIFESDIGSNMELGCALFLLSLCVLRSTAEGTVGSRFVLEPYDFLFDSAVEAYQKGDWYSVILNMEKAIRNRATVRKVKVQCRLSCANQTSFSDHLAGVGVPIPGAGSLEDLGFFQKILKRADCVSSCELEKLGSPTMHQVTEDVQQEFSKRSPYNYLQVAYFKVGPPPLHRASTLRLQPVASASSNTRQQQ